MFLFLFSVVAGKTKIVENGFRIHVERKLSGEKGKLISRHSMIIKRVVNVCFYIEKFIITTNNNNN
jgi:hypothetical protein